MICGDFLPETSQTHSGHLYYIL